MEKDFLGSLEKTQRVVKQYERENKQLLGDALEGYEGLENELKSLVLTTKNTTLLAMQHKTLDLMQDGKDKLDTDIEFLKDKVELLEEAVSSVPPDEKMMEEVVEMKDIFEDMEWGASEPVVGFRDALVDCMRTNILEPAPPGPSGPSEPSVVSSDCLEIAKRVLDIREKCSEIQTYLDDTDEAKTIFSDWKNRMETLVNAYFEGTAKEPETDHQECLDILITANQNVLTIFPLINATNETF